METIEELVNTLTEEYNQDIITWHDIQDIIEGYFMKRAGGMKEYSKIPIRQRIQEEDAVLKQIEAGIYQREVK